MSELLQASEHLSTRVRYKRTNEEIAILVHLIDPNPSDTILSVCGSGDMPFALAAAGANVIAFDESSEQITWAQIRRAALEAGNIDQFYMPFPHETVAPVEYFSDEVLEQIQTAKGAIDFIVGSLHDIANTDLSANPTKAYVSNIVTYQKKRELQVQQQLQNIASAHPELSRIVSLRTPRDLQLELTGWTRNAKASENGTQWHMIQRNAAPHVRWHVDVYDR